MQLTHLPLLIGQKSAQIWDYLLLLHTRFPKFFAASDLQSMSRFVCQIPLNFLEERSVLAVSKILFAWKRLEKKIETASPTQICFHLLPINSTSYGITIVRSSLQENEIFSENQIIDAIRNITPGTRPSKGSYLSLCTLRHQLFYIEVKKIKGGVFFRKEKQRLLSSLAHSLQQHVLPMPSLVVSENIEELLKKMRHLSQEVRYINDLPQVILAFIEYSKGMLKFLVAVVRVLKPDTPSLVDQSRHLSAGVHFTLEKVSHIGKVRKKYPKEATLFTLEIESTLFLRSHNKIDTRIVRQYIAKALEQMLGPYRDYHGGLISIEQDQILAVQKQLEEKQGTGCPLFEDIFYNIKPATARSSMTVQTGLEIALLLQKSMAHSLNPHDDLACHVETCYEPHAHTAILKTVSRARSQAIVKRILAAAPKCSHSLIEQAGIFYVCFFYPYPEANLLQSALSQALEQQPERSVSPPHSMIRLNFQGGNPPSLNPRLATDIRCHILSSFLFEGLTRINASGSAEPAAAERIEVSTDQTIYTFHLRPSHWSNGKPVTAYHFQETWKRAILLHSSFTWPNLFYPIQYANEAQRGEISIDAVGICAKNTTTLEVTLKAPCPYFLNLVATPPFLPLIDESEEPTHFNGPFALADWKHDQYLNLTKNPYYWDVQKINLSGILITMIRDPNLCYQMFLKGELDVIGDPLSPLPVNKMETLSDPIEYIKTTRMFWIHCNRESHPLQSADLRRAMSLALDRRKLVAAAFPHHTPSGSPLPPQYSEISTPTSADIEQAQAYMRAALKKLKMRASDIPPLIFTHADLPSERLLVVELQKQWKETLGLNVISQELSWNEFSTALDSKNFQMIGLFRRNLFSHPMSYFCFFTATLNHQLGWHHPKFETLFAEGKDIQGMERILIEEAPVIPIVSQTYCILHSQRVKGIQWDANGYLTLTGVSIDEKDLATYSYS